MTSQIKTVFLLLLLSGLMLLMGQAIGGQSGLMTALAFALLMNVGSYWFSDKIVLRMYNARELSPDDAPMLHRVVEELAAEARIPKPRVCLMPDESPNAFATGRNPEHGVVAVTSGIVRLLSPEELRGVLAHETAHIANRDILVQTVAGVIATVIMYLGHMLQWAAMFSGSNRNRQGAGLLGGLLLAVLAPIAASLIQFAISRSREYLADATGARFARDPLALAAALGKLDGYARQIPMRTQSAATAHMFIVAPFAGGGITSLFSTHPPVADRIARLQAMA